MKNIKNNLLLVLMIPVILFFQSFRFYQQSDESAVKAMFIYNFAKYFDWTRIESKQEFVIAVYGNNPVAPYLEKIAHLKTLNGKPIIVKIITSPEEAAGVQMLFIPNYSVRILERVQAVPNTGSVILITENSEAFNHGSHINLMNKGGRFRFELNESRMRYNNIKFSRELSTLASHTK